MPALQPAPAGPLSEAASVCEYSEDRSRRQRTAIGDDGRMPEVLGGVRLTRFLGQGGMGRVYLGYHPAFGFEVAVKVISDALGDNSRFLSEVRLAVQVQHEHVIRIYNAGIEHGRCFLVMEYVPGNTLKHLLAQQGRLSWRDAAQYLRQAALGLGALHARGIVHRDVKPSNLLLDACNRVKVADLGVARTLMDAANATATGGVVGTAGYMAPEQGQDAHQATPAADCYALGVSFYQLVTGQLPFSGMGFTDLLIAHRTRPLPDPRRLVPGLPAQVADYIARLTDKDPQKRPLDGTAAAAELGELLAQVTVSTAQRPGGGRPVVIETLGSRWPLLAGGVAACGLIALLAWNHRDHQAPPPPGPMAVAPTAPLAPPAPVVAAAVPADVWQTPPRAVFVLADHVPAAALAAIDSVCVASGLPVVERQRIDALVHEQDLSASGRADPATAGRIGRLVGGHIAVFATGIEDRIEVRTVLVETGEIVASRFVAPDEAGANAAEGLATAIALLPVQGRISASGATLQVSVGSRHGVKIGNRFGLRRVVEGPDLATATVTAVERDHATITVAPARDDAVGMMAGRLAP